MKKILFAFAIFSLAACGTHEHQTENPSVNKATISYHDTPRGISVQIIDDCEYIYCETGSGVAITHKQNCKFCEERKNNSFLNNNGE